MSSSYAAIFEEKVLREKSQEKIKIMRIPQVAKNPYLIKKLPFYKHYFYEMKVRFNNGQNIIYLMVLYVVKILNKFRNKFLVPKLFKTIKSNDCSTIVSSSVIFK